MLDRDQPEIVIDRRNELILEPVENYELSGVAPKVVFSCGAAILDGKLALYYGTADKVIGVATGKLPGKPIEENLSGGKFSL